MEEFKCTVKAAAASGRPSVAFWTRKLFLRGEEGIEEDGS